MSRCMPNCRGGSRPQLALEECNLFGESNMANFDCGLSAADCWKFWGLPGSIPAPTNNQLAHASAQATVPEDIYNNLHQMN
jgi:hypothetical protein